MICEPGEKCSDCPYFREVETDYDIEIRCAKYDKEGIMKGYKITCNTEPTNEPCDRCKYKYHPMYGSPCAECGVDFPKKFEPMDKMKYKSLEKFSCPCCGENSLGWAEDKSYAPGIPFVLITCNTCDFEFGAEWHETNCDNLLSNFECFLNDLNNNK